MLTVIATESKLMPGVNTNDLFALSANQIKSTSTYSSWEASKRDSLISIADPWQDSTCGRLVWALDEKATVNFANTFMSDLVDMVWNDGIKLEWVRGREGPTTLEWVAKYAPGLFGFVNSREASSIITMPDQKFEARTDGSLQIQVPDPSGAEPDGTLWPRMYCALPLESVRPSIH
jgi:hypothetical protein